MTVNRKKASTCISIRNRIKHDCSPKKTVIQFLDLMTELKILNSSHKKSLSKSIVQKAKIETRRRAKKAGVDETCIILLTVQSCK